jgi:hypothetical protein
MPLTKSFNELVENRAANDPEFAAALREAADTPPLTVAGGLQAQVGDRGSRQAEPHDLHV